MDVHDRLARHLLVDGYRLVLDLDRSRGSRLVDARTDRSYLDFYTFFASAPLGLNPFDDDPEFLALLGRIAANKPANSDLYTGHLADFVETFTRVLGDPELPHLFFVEGGALAVENALKCAFDWKSRRNEAAGRPRSLGTRVLHLTRAFHGRSGYTLSLTNTDPVKTDRFPMFDWPRIEVPAIHFGNVEAAEARALAQARAAFERYPHDIACFIAEPIQGEGGDNHMRPEFLQAMERMCHEYDALFVVDEVQTGAGITGTPWAHQQLGLRPDIVAFAKKVQVGGIMAGRRVDQVPDNVFRVSGRINSTWGGGLVDMVRSRRMLEIIERDGLITRAGELGQDLLTALQKIQARFPGLVRHARGRGLMCAFDLPDTTTRDRLVARLRREEGVLVLPCGDQSVRLRPALSVAAEELLEGTTAITRALEASQGLKLSA
ncbi:L-lysine 6-transaminase [Streptosporangium saharense]|uniref:L-lysine-epsilon aminotransferase n=1 Tax=Streptosporangium saharense TaxID=1706840 RepID=A0A7W7VRG3_9ACTN|nr:L-lysine 6-transaminase [Streptosporangium saharense]MBB4920071.1 L-lysine 6-transaminase [Streptosporangium saharense]